MKLGAIFILRKGVFGLSQTTRPPLYGIVSILTYRPQILHKIFENHLPPRKKIKGKTYFCPLTVFQVS